jgi:hypothetical protein
MTLKETLRELKALGNAKVRAQNAKSGAGDNQFDVSLGDIRVLAKKIRTDHPLALSLWETGNVDAQFLVSRTKGGFDDYGRDEAACNIVRSAVPCRRP